VTRIQEMDEVRVWFWDCGYCCFCFCRGDSDSSSSAKENREEREREEYFYNRENKENRYIRPQRSILVAMGLAMILYLQLLPALYKF